MPTYLVALCDLCARVTLTPLEAPNGETARCCPTCAETLRVAPSCSYGEPDVELFRELSQIVADGGVDPEEASRLAAEVARGLAAGKYRESADTLSIRLPGLLPLQLVAGSNWAGHRVALQMLRTIFEALATVHRQSVAQAKPAAQRSAPRLG